MFKIFSAALIALFLVACSSKGEDLSNVEAKLVVGKSLANLTLNDQFAKPHTLPADTKKVIFAFSKDAAHTCNDFFVTQTPSYLSDNKTVFIADVSAAPSLIRSMFIMPGLKDFKHTVLILDNKAEAAPFRKDVENEKIVVVYLKNRKISAIKTLNSATELQKVIEAH